MKSDTYFQGLMLYKTNDNSILKLYELKIFDMLTFLTKQYQIL